MIKHATNTFLATSISLANELASIGEIHGADNNAVARAMKMDSRIGSKAYVRPGLGFSGGHLSRDPKALQNVARPLKHALPLIDAVLQVNDQVFERVAINIERMAPRTVCILGYSFKAETDDVHFSPTKIIIDWLRRFGKREDNEMNIIGYDPRMNGKWEELKEVGIGPGHMPAWIAIERKPIDPGGVDVFVVVTPLPEFKKLDWSRCAPALVYDLCDGVDKNAVLGAGLSYKAIWQPTEHP
jgi:nucleotide sugar dehydrogenase